MDTAGAGKPDVLGDGHSPGVVLLVGAAWRRMNRPTDEIDTRLDIEQVLDRLPPQQRRAVLLYGAGYSQSEIALKFGVSRPAICQLFGRIVNKQAQTCLIDIEDIYAP